MSNKSKFFIAAIPLFLAIFIDGMGMGLFFPILNAMLMDTGPTGFFDPHTSFAFRDFAFGLTSGIFMLFWFFGAPFLGDLSDKIGRKKCLIACLAGAACGYVFSAMAVIFHSLALLLLGRVIAGFTGSSQAIAQAAIVDLSNPNDKSFHLGLILCSASLGFIFGPLIGGGLSDSNLVRWFDYSIPFYFATIVSILNVFLIAFLFKETFKKAGKFKFKIHQAIYIFMSAFTHESGHIKFLSTTLLILMLGWSSFYAFIALFLVQNYHFTTGLVAIYLAVLALGFGISSGFLIPAINKKLSLTTSITLGAFLMAIGVYITLMIHNSLLTWGSSFLVGAAFALIYSGILTLFSNQVDENSQGWVMGVTGAIMAFAFGISGPLAGLIVNYGSEIPILFAFIGIAASGVMMLFFRKL